MTAAYPPHLRPCLRAKRRTQPAAFTVAEPRRGFAYVREIGTDMPVFWDVSFRFTPAEALVFQVWFKYQINRGVDEFTLPLRTEFGLLEHTCRFLDDSLLDTSESGESYSYKATITARAQVVPDGYEDAADLVVGLPDWTGWAAYLDRAVNVTIPA